MKEGKDGVIHLTNIKGSKGLKGYKSLADNSIGKRYSLVYINNKGLKKMESPNSKSRSKIIKYIKTISPKCGVSPALIMAIIEAESSFRVTATSPKGAMGLMQLMPATAKYLGVTAPYDPKQNIKGGCKYFKKLLGQFGQDISLALAAYNAGPRAVKKYKGIPPYNETEDYVDKVLWLYYHFREKLRKTNS